MDKGEFYKNLRDNEPTLSFPGGNQQFSANAPFHRELLTNFNIGEVNSLQKADAISDAKPRVEVLNSSWLDLVWYVKSQKAGRYIVVIFFDPLATMSPKNPTGFGSLVGRDIPLREIKDLIFDPSPGAKYLEDGAIGNKEVSYIGTLQVMQDKIDEDNANVEELTSAQKSGRTRSQNASQKKFDERADFYSFNPDSEDNESIFENFNTSNNGDEIHSSSFEDDIERLNDIRQMKDYIKQLKKYEQLQLENNANRFVAKKILRDFETMFGISIESRIKFKIMGAMTGGKFNPASGYKIRFMVKNFNDLMEKDGGIKMGAITKRFFNDKNPLNNVKGGRYSLKMQQDIINAYKRKIKREKLAKEFIILNRDKIDFPNQTGKEVSEKMDTGKIRKYHGEYKEFHFPNRIPKKKSIILKITKKAIKLFMFL